MAFTFIYLPGIFFTQFPSFKVGCSTSLQVQSKVVFQHYFTFIFSHGRQLQRMRTQFTNGYYHNPGTIIYSIT